MSLIECLTDIAKSLDLTQVIPYYIQHHYLTSIECLRFRPFDLYDYTRNVEYIELLYRKRLNNEIFIDALKESNQLELAKLINAKLRCSGAVLSQRIQKSLKESYVERFRKVYPFSLPFTFDIENTWVSLALKEDSEYSPVTEDHAELLKKAFDKANMLIIEGDPASGKTSLMRRLAYEWGKEMHDCSHFYLIVYSEFREVRDGAFETIADLVLHYSKNYLDEKDFESLVLLIKNKQFCKDHHILVLLDGYDESSLDKQCSELSIYLTAKTIRNAPLFNIVMTTRKGYLSNLRGREGRFVFADVLGFTTDKQKNKYISNHFSTKEEVESTASIAAVHRLFQVNESLNKLAETPLFLTFICIVHERIIDGTLAELYYNIIWWLIDRNQQDFPDRDIPVLFEFESDSHDKLKTIQDNCFRFPQLHCLGKMAFNNTKKSVFLQSDSDIFNLKPILEQVGLLRKEEIYDRSYRLQTKFFFIHRTIQEFLAAFFCLSSDEIFGDKIFSPNFNSNSNVNDYDHKNEYEKFAFRIALSEKMPISPARRQVYFEKIISLTLFLELDTFNLAEGLNIELLNRCFSQCSNVVDLTLYGSGSNEIVLQNSINLSKMTELSKFHFGYANILLQVPLSHVQIPQDQSMNQSKSFVFLKRNKIDVSLQCVTFKSAMQFSESMGYFFKYLADGSILSFQNIIVKSDVESSFTFDIEAYKWSESFMREIPQIFFTEHDINEALGYAKNAKTLTIFNPKTVASKFSLEYFNNLSELVIAKLIFSKNDDLLSLSNMISISSLMFKDCIFADNTRVSFTNCPSLTTLTFNWCKIKSSTALGFSNLLAIKLLKFVQCEIDLSAWQSITDEIKSSSVRRLAIFSDFFIKEENSEFFYHLEKCKHIEEIELLDWEWTDFSTDSSEEKFVINLCRLVRQIQGLKTIYLQIGAGKLKNNSEKLIEKAGQEGHADFSISYL